MKAFNIGKQFNSHPIGRYYSDGEGSGEEFREDFLLPKLSALGEGEKLCVIIDDDVDGYGSSFLVEAFAGCVIYGHYKSQELLSKLDIVFHDEEFEFFAKRVSKYIADAKYNSEKYVKTKKA
ncbi:STAS-like domain-containing protein [Teredinibacter haidensis]|uniref:STAS-like domain-containing protein n=1 Tax=Teredinibacter haidensis TaxID=2731755 RepID=UPI0009488DCA|nr:DUF4325 domain-containing protein [Teredinibacter haidensis]